MVMDAWRIFSPRLVGPMVGQPSIRGHRISALAAHPPTWRRLGPLRRPIGGPGLADHGWWERTRAGRRKYDGITGAASRLNGPSLQVRPPSGRCFCFWARAAQLGPISVVFRFGSRPEPISAPRTGSVAQKAVPCEQADLSPCPYPDGRQPWRPYVDGPIGAGGRTVPSVVRMMAAAYGLSRRSSWCEGV
jgi:hypothetical protein